MSANKWTPGPWRFELNRFNSGHEDAGLSAYGSVMSVNDDWFICGIEDAKEWEANAALISQVPELYEALLGCIEHMEWSTAQGKEALLKAKSVLAKARGEQP
jgi:hypothetical protein